MIISILSLLLGFLLTYATAYASGVRDTKLKRLDGIKF